MNLHLTKNTRYQVGELSVFDEFPLHIRNGRYTHTFFFNDEDAVSRTIDYLYKMQDNFEEHNYSAVEFDIDLLMNIIFQGSMFYACYPFVYED